MKRKRKKNMRSGKTEMTGEEPKGRKTEDARRVVI